MASEQPVKHKNIDKSNAANNKEEEKKEISHGKPALQQNSFIDAVTPPITGLLKALRNICMGNYNAKIRLRTQNYCDDKTAAGFVEKHGQKRDGIKFVIAHHASDMFMIPTYLPANKQITKKIKKIARKKGDDGFKGNVVWIVCRGKSKFAPEAASSVAFDASVHVWDGEVLLCENTIWKEIPFSEQDLANIPRANTAEECVSRIKDEWFKDEMLQCKVNHEKKNRCILMPYEQIVRMVKNRRKKVVRWKEVVKNSKCFVDLSHDLPVYDKDACLKELGLGQKSQGGIITYDPYYHQYHEMEIFYISLLMLLLFFCLICMAISYFCGFSCGIFATNFSRRIKYNATDANDHV